MDGRVPSNRDKQLLIGPRSSAQDQHQDGHASRILYCARSGTDRICVGGWYGGKVVCVAYI